MKRLISTALVSLVLSATVAFAGEKTVKLNVGGMSCISCVYQVKAALRKVNGVSKIEVSLEKSEAVVTFDDEKANIAALAKAATNAGFPTKLAKEGG